MNYKERTTPGEPESFSKNQMPLPEVELCKAQDQHGTLTSVLGALMWIAFRTRPNLCWAVTSVPRAVRAN
eukprot:4675385-Prorocentrum_lima.AAC.1